MDQAAVPQEELSLDTVMARRFELVETINIISGKHKGELEPHNEELHLCEVFIKDEMNKAGMTQCKTAAGQAFFTTKDSAGVESWDQVIGLLLAAPAPEGVDAAQWQATLAHIQAHGNWHFLNKAINKTAVKEYIDEHKANPPGVKYDTYRDLSWRKGKG